MLLKFILKCSMPTLTFCFSIYFNPKILYFFACHRHCCPISKQGKLVTSLCIINWGIALFHCIQIQHDGKSWRTNKENKRTCLQIVFLWFCPPALGCTILLNLIFSLLKMGCCTILVICKNQAIYSKFEVMYTTLRKWIDLLVCLVSFLDYGISSNC